MSCPYPEATAVEARLGWLDDAAAQAYERHLVHCGRCRSLRTAERRLAEDLAALRGEFPHRLDVTTRVMARISRRVRSGLTETSPREWAGASAAALLVAAAGLAAAWRFRGAAQRTIETLLALLASLRGVAGTALELLSGLLVLPLKLIGSLLRAVQDLEPYLAWLRPAGLTAGLLLVGIMLATTAYFVVRDLRYAPATAED